MGEKLIIGPFNRGLKTDREPFAIDNDSFPSLINAYQWRGRIKRKRGTAPLCRLQTSLPTAGIALSVLTNGTDTYTITDVLNDPNVLFSPGVTIRSKFPDAQIIPTSIDITVNGGGGIYLDVGGTGNLSSAEGSGTINYSNGALSITFTVIPGAGNSVILKLSFFPALPVMGLEDLTLTTTQFPGTLGFDTTLVYNIPTTTPTTPYNVGFYKNPVGSALLPGYTQKATQTPLWWNGQNYQQFWSTNYQGAFWVTNGITVPFSITNIGMQFAPSATIGYISNTATTLVVTIAGSPLVVGDFVFANEWDTSSTTNGLNFQTGYVTAFNAGTGQYTITFPFATITAGPHTPGILQYLTNRSDTTKDCLRWYDGDPTINAGANGWVNFCPPLSLLKYSISGLTPQQYYLVGARMIIPFKDRLLFYGPVIQTSGAGSQLYLNDTVIFSENGTPFYTASWTDTTSNYAINPVAVYNPILVPINQTAVPFAFFEDNTGFGGFQSAGTDQPITTVGVNEDAHIVGFSTIQARLIYTGNDLGPFNFYIINSDLGSSSTFSIVTMDEGILTRGNRGFIITNQTSAKRFDLEILETSFDNISNDNNGNERLCSQRDFINEWVYFTYYSTENDNPNVFTFPNQTLQYNYRDQSWAIFNESYTTYGLFRKATGYTWLTIPWAWENWTQPWNAGAAEILQPLVIAGNQQGFVIIRDEGTQETPSLFIENIVNSTITSPNHQLDNGDYIIITGALGTVGAQVNGNIFSINGATIDTFNIMPTLAGGTYVGGGVITKIYVPFIQSKEFPQSWAMGRKTRLGPQQYLLSKTDQSQIQLLIFLSTNEDFAFNNPLSVPQDDTIYSTVLFTCPESTNLGLTPANTNLQMPVVNSQSQIWHRVNTSLLGDTVQFALTMSDAQVRSVDANGNPINAFEEIEFHGAILDLQPSSLLS